MNSRVISFFDVCSTYLNQIKGLFDGNAGMIEKFPFEGEGIAALEKLGEINQEAGRGAAGGMVSAAVKTEMPYCRFDASDKEGTVAKEDDDWALKVFESFKAAQEDRGSIRIPGDLTNTGLRLGCQDPGGSWSWKLKEIVRAGGTDMKNTFEAVLKALEHEMSKALEPVFKKHAEEAADKDLKHEEVQKQFKEKEKELQKETNRKTTLVKSFAKNKTALEEQKAEATKHKKAVKAKLKKI